MQNGNGEAANHGQGSVIDAINARRAQAGKLKAGIAAASSSDMFKGSVSLPVSI